MSGNIFLVPDPSQPEDVFYNDNYILPGLPSGRSAAMSRSGQKRLTTPKAVARNPGHDPEKHALGLDPRVGTGFSRTKDLVCPGIMPESKA
jgi:hypothetical protein